jgi:putative ABC transport system permease protein
VIALKGNEEDIGLVNLEYELKGMMRKLRGLKPYEEDDFAINRPEMISNEIGKIFNILTLAGAIIGGFSILVGAFGIANIMFVSVNERIGVIGIQKSLGAKNYFILFQFLFEAVFLSLIGGFFGLLLAAGITLVPMGTFEVTMVWKNVILGVSISTVVGILSGIVPAAMAARLDPVVAIRAN